MMFPGLMQFYFNLKVFLKIQTKRKTLENFCKTAWIHSESFPKKKKELTGHFEGRIVRHPQTKKLTNKNVFPIRQREGEKKSF